MITNTWRLYISKFPIVVVFLFFKKNTESCSVLKGTFFTRPSGLSLLQQLSDLTQADNRVRLKWNQKQFVLVWAIIPFPKSHASPFSPLSSALYLLPRIKRQDFRHSYKKQLLSNFPHRNILEAIQDLHIFFQITNGMPFREPQGPLLTQMEQNFSTHLWNV